ncbi:MAG: hypothetical protein MI919_38450, partial [Holophagales bacterium]|nr:hypothetical protein [Holophagales bacterium]
MHLRSCTLLLFAALLLALPSGAFAQPTEIQVPCTGVPIADGTALRTAYTTIVGNTAASPFVVRPDPCLYDLGAATLTIRNFIDLIGLGRNDTIITSQVDPAVTPNNGTLTVPGGVDAEVANLTIRNDSTNNQGIALWNASNLFVTADSIYETSTLTDALAIHTTGSLRGDSLVLRALTVGEEVIAATSVGVEDVGGNSVWTNTLIIAGGPPCTSATGIVLDGSNATILTTNIIVDCQTSTGIDIFGGSDPKISNNHINVEASGPGTALGINVSGPGVVAVVTDTNVRANAT